MRKVVLHIVFLLLIAFSLPGQNLTLKPDGHEIKLGEQIKVCVILTAPDSAHVKMPVSVDIKPDEISIVDELEADTSYFNDVGEKLIEINQKYIITAFDTGVHEVIFPPGFVNDKEARAESFFIAVEGVEVDPEADFADAKPPVEFPYTFKEILWIIGKYLLVAWAVLVLAAVLVYLLGKDKKPETEELPDKPAVPAHIGALEAIAQLEKSDFLEKGKHKKYHIKLSEIPRRYLEERFDVTALESTTNEIKTHLQTVDISAELKEQLIRSLSISDLAKFAKVIPSQSENEFALKAVKGFIEQTKKTEEREE